MIAKTLSGLPFLDGSYGGVYAGRSTLICGRSGTGKTIAACHFIQQGLEQQERSLILSTMPANDLVIMAGALGFNFSPSIDQRDLILLEYQSFVPGTTIGWKSIPADGFNQLREIIETNSISRLVLDTVLPWVALSDVDRMTEQVFSFVRSCDRLGVTTVMTLPKPVSTMAFRLKKTLETNTPISVLLSPGEQTGHYTWHTVKYLGEQKSTFPEPYTIVPKAGMVPLIGEEAPAPIPPAEAVAQAEAGGKRVRFSTLIPVTGPSEKKASQADVTPPPEKPQGPVRLSSTWKPKLNNP